MLTTPIEKTVSVTESIPEKSISTTIPLYYDIEGRDISPLKSQTKKERSKNFKAFLSKNGATSHNLIDLINRGGDLGAILSEESVVCILIDKGEIRFGAQLGKGAYGRVRDIIFPSDPKDYVVKESLGTKLPKACATQDLIFRPKNNGSADKGIPDPIVLPSGSLLCTDTVSEFYIALLVADLLKRNISINFLDVIYFGVCKGHFARQYTFMEKVSTSLYKVKERLSEEQINSIYIQILHAIAVYQREYKIVHGDLHMGNVLIDEIQSQAKYLEYKIDDTILYVPLNMYLAKISDWGLAFKYEYRIVGNKSIFENKFRGAVPNFYNAAYDVAYITMNMNKGGLKSDLIKEVLKWMLNGNDINKIFRMEKEEGRYRPRVESLETLLAHVTPDAILKSDLVKRYTFKPKRARMIKGGVL